MVTHQVSATDIISLLSAHDTTTTQGILEMPRAREQCLFLAEVLPKCSLHEGNVFFFLAHGQRAIPFPSKDAAEMLTAFEQRLFFFFSSRGASEIGHSLARQAAGGRDWQCQPTRASSSSSSGSGSRMRARAGAYRWLHSSSCLLID